MHTLTLSCPIPQPVFNNKYNGFLLLLLLIAPCLIDKGEHTALSMFACVFRRVRVYSWSLSMFACVFRRVRVYSWSLSMFACVFRRVRVYSCGSVVYNRALRSGRTEGWACQQCVN